MSAIDVYLSRPWAKHQSAKPGSIEVPLRTVTQAFDEATQRDPARTAVAFYGRSITYRELRDATDRLANAFAKLGLKKGDRIALYLVNSPQFIIAYFAALKCGATVTRNVRNARRSPSTTERASSSNGSVFTSRGDPTSLRTRPRTVPGIPDQMLRCSSRDRIAKGSMTVCRCRGYL